MRAVMVDGPKGMQKFRSDPEAMKIIEKLNSVLGSAGFGATRE
jgi:hypothetical protein